MKLNKEERELIHHWYKKCRELGMIENTCNNDCEYYEECSSILSKLNKDKPRFSRIEKDITLLWFLSCEDYMIGTQRIPCNSCKDFKNCKKIRIKFWGTIKPA